MNTRICFKTDSSSNWETLNPVLFNGEFGVEQTNDSSKLKIGDGEKSFRRLSWWGPQPIEDELLELYAHLHLAFLSQENTRLGSSLLGG